MSHRYHILEECNCNENHVFLLNLKADKLRDIA